MNMDGLKGKVVIITGGAGLLGSSYCRACAEAGCKVILVDVDRKGKKLADEIGADFFDTDITSESDVKKLVDSVIKKHGKIDALVNNAYPRNKDYGKKFEDVTYDSFCENISMHLGGYFLMAREVSKMMMKQKSGVIMNKDYGKKFEDVTYDSFCENISMHLGGYFLMAREVSKMMMKQKSGVIINK